MRRFDIRHDFATLPIGHVDSLSYTTVTISPTIAVIGGGLAAHTTAFELYHLDCEVVIVHESSPGATGLWGGLGSVFGPVADPPDDAAGAVERRESPTPTLRRDRASRWRALAERRPFHPYRRLQLDREDVEPHLDAALDRLAYPGLTRLDDETVRPGPYGHPTCPDLAAPSLLPLDFAPGTTVGVVRCPDLSNWRADALADYLHSADNLRARAITIDPFETLEASGHPVRVATDLETRWEESGGDTYIEPLRAAIGDHVLDQVVLPPCIGATHETHTAMWSRLTDALHTPVAEWPAPRDAVFGWRLDRWLRRRDDLERIDDRVVALSTGDDRLEGIELESGESHQVDGAVLATGRWVGGGLPAEPPMREPLSSVPLWLDGAPVANPEDVHLADYLGDHPWSDHRLFRMGLAIDEQARPLDRDGEPAFDALAAAGRMLAGFHPHHDGCAMGVDLVTGRMAARRLVERL